MKYVCLFKSNGGLVCKAELTFKNKKEAVDELKSLRKTQISWAILVNYKTGKIVEVK